MVTNRRAKGPGPHYHGCIRCHHRYEDCCTSKDVNDICVWCRGGIGFTILRDNAAPKDCCRQRSRLPTKDERKVYRLAGDGLWFICDECKRTHPIDDPKITEQP